MITSLNYSKTREKIKYYIASWEAKGYPYGIPDEAPVVLERNLLVPSYRMICRALLKNDYTLQSLGFDREPCLLYNQLKKQELKELGVIKVDCIQLGLFGESYECLR